MAARLAEAARDLARAGRPGPRPSGGGGEGGGHGGEGGADGGVLGGGGAAGLAAGFAAVAAEALLRGMLAMKTLDDLRAAAAAVAEALPAGDQKAAAFAALAGMLEQGLATGILAVECARWLCMDQRMRESMLQDSDFIATALGAALGAGAVASEARAGEAALVGTTFDFLEDCFAQDAPLARACCKRLGAARSLRKLAARQQQQQQQQQQQVVPAAGRRMQRLLAHCE